MVGRVLHRGKTVYLFIRLAHHHKTATAMLHQFGYKLHLTLKLQTYIITLVAMTAWQKEFQPYIRVAYHNVVIKYTC